MSDRIDKKTLIQLVSNRVGRDADAVGEIVEATLEEIYEALKRGECVSLRNFGTFYVRPAQHDPTGRRPTPGHAVVLRAVGCVKRTRCQRIPGSPWCVSRTLQDSGVAAGAKRPFSTSRLCGVAPPRFPIARVLPKRLAGDGP